MEPPEQGDARIDLLCWEHQDIELSFPARAAEAERRDCCATFAFDGACAK